MEHLAVVSGPAPVVRRPLLSASVDGFAAWLFAPVLEREAPRLLDLAVERGFDAGLVAQAARVVAAVRQAGDEWATWRAAADGNTAVVEAAMPSGSEGEEITTAEAAEMLGVRPRRVRQMLAAGELRGRVVGGVWLVSRSSVLVLCEARRRAA